MPQWCCWRSSLKAYTDAINVPVAIASRAISRCTRGNLETWFDQRDPTTWLTDHPSELVCVRDVPVCIIDRHDEYTVGRNSRFLPIRPPLLPHRSGQIRRMVSHQSDHHQMIWYTCILHSWPVLGGLTSEGSHRRGLGHIQLYRDRGTYICRSTKILSFLHEEEENLINKQNNLNCKQR